MHDTTNVGAPPPMDCEALVSRMGARERQNFERQILACESKPDPGLAERWRRLGCLFLSLTPEPAKAGGGQSKFTGVNTVQCFIPDGKYRQQVFAMHLRDDGSLAICSPDVLENAICGGILSEHRETDGPNTYRLVASGEALTIHFLDRNTLSPEFFYKGMTGWHKKAICMTLPARASAAQTAVVERICTMAAIRWAPAPE